MQKKSVKDIVKQEFNQAVDKLAGEFELLDTHNFSIGLCAVHGTNSGTIARYLRSEKRAKRFENNSQGRKNHQLN